MNKEHLEQFKRDHQGELWEELDHSLFKKPIHRISGEDFPDLEPEEQVALLKETASVLGTQKPMSTVLLDSYKALVGSLSLPEETKARLLVMPSTVLLPSTKHLTG